MDQIEANIHFFVDKEPGETNEETYERFLCILDGLGIQWIGIGEPKLIHDDEEEETKKLAEWQKELMLKHKD